MSWLLGGGLTVLAGLWVAWNAVAPHAAVRAAQPISPGRLPAELLRRGEAKHVHFYVLPLQLGYGYSVWVPGRGAAVIFDQEFFRRATPELVRFVVAHELGHAAARHHLARWVVVVSGAVLFRWGRRQLLRMEAEADAYATALTGSRREFWPDRLPPLPTEERK